MGWKWDAVRGDPRGVVLDLGDLFLELIADHPAHTAQLSGQDESSHGQFLKRECISVVISVHCLLKSPVARQASVFL